MVASESPPTRLSTVPFIAHLDFEAPINPQVSQSTHLYTCTFSHFQAIFDMIDSDGNGFVDFIEYMVAVSANRSGAN